MWPLYWVSLIQPRRCEAPNTGRTRDPDKAMVEEMWKASEEGSGSTEGGASECGAETRRPARGASEGGAETRSPARQLIPASDRPTGNQCTAPTVNHVT